MEVNPNIQQSLHEIASLLVLVHDFYLKEARGREISIALLRLLHDVGLQTVVSFLDSERLRRKVMLSTNANIMGYEIFYDWLRHLSKFVFGFQEKEPRRALHMLLTQHIIPCTTRIKVSNDSKEFADVVQSFTRMTDRALKILTEFSDFVLCWYLDILTHGDASNNHGAGQSYWRSICSHAGGGLVAADLVTASLRTVTPTILSEGELDSLVMISADSNDCISFLGFLYVLELVADRIDIDDFFCVDVEQARENRMLLLLKVMLEGQFAAVYESRLSMMALHAPKVPDGKLHVAVLLWWLCDAQYALHCQQSIGALHGVLRKQITFRNPEDSPVDGMPRLPLLFLSLLRKLLGDVQLPASNPSTFCDPTADYSLFSLAVHAPLVFVSPNSSPALFFCYCEEACARWTASAQIISAVLDSFPTPHCDPKYLPITAVHSHYEGFLEACAQISGADLQSHFLKHFGEHCTDSEALTTRETIQYCFYELSYHICMKNKLLQSIHGDWQRSANIIFTLFLEVLTKQSPTALASMNKAKHSIDVAMEGAKGLLDSRRSPVPAAPVPQKSANPIKPAQLSSAASSSNSLLSSTSSTNIKRASIKAEYSIFDITVLLMHFPAVDFSLNPWAIAALASGLDDESSMHALDGNMAGGVGSSLTTLLKGFGNKYQVTVPELSAFFASFYSTTNHGPESILQSWVLRLLRADNVLRLLSLNEDLLQWEFSRCYSKYPNSADPFTGDILSPILSSHAVSKQLIFPLISFAKAKAWAAAMTPLSLDEITEHFSLASGISSKCKGWLTYSTFIIFAIRCFITPLADQHNADDAVIEEAHVLQRLRIMLQSFSKQLTAVQQALQLRILFPLFQQQRNNESNSDGISVDLAFKRSLCDNCIAQFHKQLAASPGIVAKGSQQSPHIVAQRQQYVPPRPPSAIWDAARFLHCTLHLGMAEHLQLPLDHFWAVFGMHLKEINLMDVLSTSVAPLPVKIDADVLVKLLDTVCSLSAHLEQRHPTLRMPAIDECKLYHAGIVPILTAVVEQSLSSADRRPEDGLLIEDILRYGGHECMQALSEHKAFLSLAYHNMQASSEQVFVFPAQLFLRNPPTENEVPLNMICSLLSCANLLSMQEVAKEVKRSLHRRLRPLCCPRSVMAEDIAGPCMPPHWSNNAVTAVTISFAELEEAFLRCAYLIWEKSNAAKAHQDTIIAHRMVGDDLPIALDARNQQISLAYRNEVIKHLKNIQSKRTSPKSVRAWGVDFVKPYSALLQGCIQTNSSSSSSSSSSPPATVAGAQRLTWLQLISRSAPSSPSNKDVRITNEHDSSSPLNGALSEILLNKLNHSVADPAARAHVDAPAPTSPHAHAFRPISAPIAAVAAVIPEKGPQVFRFDEDDAPFAQSTLFGDAKEALWPIFATYCSCGDSLDPGKLSGPNLFTLLSKLGVLTDQTLLTDMGILFHQISMRSLSISPISTVKALLSAHSEASVTEAPSLTFEEFLIFLYLFSIMRYEGNLKQLEDIPWPKPAPGRAAKRSKHWFQYWQEQMSSSNSFQRLLAECIMPIVKKQTLLAFPEDARLRDRFACVFSIEVLLAVESSEGLLQVFFEKRLHKDSIGDGSMLAAIMAALRKVKLIPAVVDEPQVVDLIKDVIPETPRADGNPKELLFPQWEWLLSVVCFQAVETAVRQNKANVDMERLPYLLSDVITAVARGLVKQ